MKLSDRISPYLFAAMLLLCAISVHAQTTSTLTGTITDSSGSPLNGTLVMRLPVPAQYTPTNIAVAPTPVTFRVLNGAITGGLPLYDVAALQPSNLYYIARGYDQTGSLQFYGNYVVTGATFNLGAATPTSITTSNISYLSPAFLGGNNTWTGTNVYNGATIFNGPVTFNGLINGGQFGTTISVANQSPTGTTLDTLTVATGAPGVAIIAPISTAAAILGITTSGAGATGTAVIQQSGSAPCVFDGGTTSGDYVQISSTTAGQCHDSGIAPPNRPSTGGEVVGTVQSTNVSAGTYNVILALQSPPFAGPTINVPNAGTTGTTLGTLTKLTTANPSTAVIMATTDTSGIQGVTVAGAGTSGTATIQTAGIVSCVFDGATTANDSVQISPTVAGNCHDAGTTLAGGLGRVLSTNASAGTYNVALQLQPGGNDGFDQDENFLACTTSGNSCTVPVTWPGGTTQPFPDNNVIITCAPVGFVTSVVGWAITNVTASGFTWNESALGLNAQGGYTSASCHGHHK
jgi:hypothetical protein